MPSAPPPDAVSSPPVNARPTNNQFLYQAHFHWEHFPHELGEAPEGLPVAASASPANKTEACTSVTTAFLQVLAILNGVEVRRTRAPRNVLKLLSIHTRRTKVVDLSSCTHRVPDELRRHSLFDLDGNEYSTNLDRNRYGGDDQYLASVVRFNLEFLSLCPRLVTVEVLDVKPHTVAAVSAAAPGSATGGVVASTLVRASD